MPREAPELRLIRETLEGVMHPSTASTIFFQALEASGGHLPRDATEALVLVRGPLSSLLADRLGEADRDSILGPLEQMLSSIAPAVPTPPEGARRKPRRRPSRHDDPTRNLELSSETLPVFVLSGDKRLGALLKTVLGPDVLSAVWVGDAAMLHERIEQIPPALFVVDASNFAAVEPLELVETLAAMEQEIVTAVWGADLPYGQSLLIAAQQAEVTLTPFDRREGVEPLMDLIRSRRA
jgi:hypothetical protein